jgi:hypothetical protein
MVPIDNKTNQEPNYSDYELEIKNLSEEMKGICKGIEDIVSNYHVRKRKEVRQDFLPLCEKTENLKKIFLKKIENRKEENVFETNFKYFYKNFKSDEDTLREKCPPTEVIVLRRIGDLFCCLVLPVFCCLGYGCCTGRFYGPCGDNSLEDLNPNSEEEVRRFLLTHPNYDSDLKRLY